MFALLLIDGLSMAEERVTALLYNELGGVPLVGGSAGDDMAFERTCVLVNGRFRSDAAVVCLVETTLPFEVFRTQHLRPREERLVITEADPEQRRVREIDGEVAAVAYAEHLGLTADDLDTSVFSRHPVLLKIGGEFYVRSIQRVEPDGSLVFFCAIDNGLVMSLGESADLHRQLERDLNELEDRLGEPHLILGCDCILRRTELEDLDNLEPVGELLARRKVFGFNTYGEQYNALHVNQTLTGVAIRGGA